MLPPLDPDLVRRLQLGCESARREMTEWSLRAGTSIARAMRVPPADVEEISQDTAIKGERSLTGRSGVSEIRSWIARIAINLCIDHFRRNPPDRLSVPYESLIDHASPSPTPEGDLEYAELWVLLGKAMERLNPGERQVFILRHIVELSVEETAVAVGCPRGTVKSRDHSARRKLAADLARDAWRT